MVRQDNMVRKTICLIYGVQITSDYGSSLVTRSRLIFSQCYVRPCLYRGTISYFYNLVRMMSVVDGSPRGYDFAITVERQADRAYGTEISPRSFVISFVILLYTISYNICI